jgi:hypothetical protein
MPILRENAPWAKSAGIFHHASLVHVSLIANSSVPK